MEKLIDTEELNIILQEIIDKNWDIKHNNSDWQYIKEVDKIILRIKQGIENYLRFEIKI
jgi:hypothetical protein